MTIAELEVRITGNNAGAIAALAQTDAAVAASTASVTAHGAAVDATSSKLTAFGAAGTIALGALGVAAGVALVKSAEAATSFQTLLSTIEHNTTMSSSQAQAMGETIKRMASESGASLEQLGNGYMHITNLGFSAAQSTDILTAAMHSAVATGGSVADTANLLASVMKEYGNSNLSAAQTMDVLHEAAATGNMTLEQFVQASGKVMALNASLGGSLTDVSAAFSTLTQHGETASQAATQLTGILTHIVQPTSQAKAEIASLAQTTGIDLTKDFSEAGLQSKGFAGIMDDLSKVVAATGDESFIMKLIPGIRGGIGALSLATIGSADFKTHLADLAAAQRDGTISSQAYEERQKTLANELQVAGANVKLMGIAIGSELIPPIAAVTTTITPVIKGLADFSNEHSQLTASLLAGVGVFGTVVGGMGALRLGAAALAPAYSLFTGELFRTYAALDTVTVSATANTTATAANATATATAATAHQADIDYIRAEAVAMGELITAEEAETMAARENAAATAASTAARSGAADASTAAEGISMVGAAGAMLGPLALGAAVAGAAYVTFGKQMYEWAGQSVAVRAEASQLNEANAKIKQGVDDVTAAMMKQGGTTQTTLQFAQSQRDSMHAQADAYAQEAEAIYQSTLAMSKKDAAATLNGKAYQDIIYAAKTATTQALAWDSVVKQNTQTLKTEADAALNNAAAMRNAGIAIDGNALAAERADAANTKLESLVSKATKTYSSHQEALTQVAAAQSAVSEGGTALSDFIAAIDDGLKSTDPLTKAVAQSQRDWLDVIQNSSPTVVNLTLAVADAQQQQKLLNDEFQRATDNKASVGDTLDFIKDHIHGIGQEAQLAQDAIDKLFGKPSAAEQSLTAQIKGVQATDAGLQADIAGSTSADRYIASLQKKRDEAVKSAASDTDLAKIDRDLKTQTDALTAAEGDQGTQEGLNVIATQKAIDKNVDHIGVLQAQLDALKTTREAQQADIDLNNHRGATIGELNTTYGLALGGMADADKNTMDPAVTTTTGLFDTLKGSVLAAMGAISDMGSMHPDFSGINGAVSGVSGRGNQAGTMTPEQAIAAASAGTQTGGAGALPASWYAAIQASESTLPLPAPGSPQPMFGWAPGATGSVGTGHYTSGGTAAGSAGVGAAPGYTNQSLFPDIATGERALDEFWKKFPDAVAAVEKNDFGAFIDALVAHGYAGPGEWGTSSASSRPVLGRGDVGAFSGSTGSTTSAGSSGTYRLAMPVDLASSADHNGRETQPYGPTDETAEPIINGVYFHQGVDYGVAYGTNVRASGAGRIVSAGDQGDGYGNSVVEDLGNGVKTLVGHLEQINVQVGQMVNAGDSLGLAGNTGVSKGPHVHFAVMKDGQFVDPQPYLDGAALLQGAQSAPTASSAGATGASSGSRASGASGVVGGPLGSGDRNPVANPDTPIDKALTPDQLAQAQIDASNRATQVDLDNRAEVRRLNTLTGTEQQNSSDRVTAAVLADDAQQEQSARATATASEQATQAASQARAEANTALTKAVGTEERTQAKIAFDQADATYRRLNVISNADFADWTAAQQKRTNDNRTFLSQQTQDARDAAQDQQNALRATNEVEQALGIENVRDKATVNAQTLAQDQAMAAAHLPIVLAAINAETDANNALRDARRRRDDPSLTAGERQAASDGIAALQTTATIAAQTAQTEIAAQRQYTGYVTQDNAALRAQAADLGKFVVSTGAAATAARIEQLQHELAATTDTHQRATISAQIAAQEQKLAGDGSVEALGESYAAQYQQILGTTNAFFQAELNLEATYNAQKLAGATDEQLAETAGNIATANTAVEAGRQALAALTQQYQDRQKAATAANQAIQSSDRQTATAAASAAGHAGAAPSGNNTTFLARGYDEWRYNAAIAQNIAAGMGSVSNGAGGFGPAAIPHLATGGIVTGPTIAMIGEGGEHEAVIPLSRLMGSSNDSGSRQAPQPVHLHLHTDGKEIGKAFVSDLNAQRDLRPVLR